MVKIVDLAQQLLGAEGHEALSPERLTAYYQRNSQVLGRHIHDAMSRQDLGALEPLAAKVHRHIQDELPAIQLYYHEVIGILDRMVARVEDLFGSLTGISIVVCVGCNSAAGWADTIGEQNCAFLAVEKPQAHPDVMLAHEIAHHISVNKWDRVVDGFYREGVACYLSSVIAPGYADSTYTLIEADSYPRYLDWIEEHIDQWRVDAFKELAVLNDVHKRYFTSSYNRDVPNVGYLIGFLFVRHLTQSWSSAELGHLGTDEATIEREFLRFAEEYRQGVNGNVGC